MKTEIKSFDELTTKELYDLLQLREEVFIVEQNCPYNDIDGNDEKAYHLLLYKNAVLIGYTRLFSPGIKYNDCSIGRVVIKKEERLKFYGKKLMEDSIHFLNKKFSGISITLSAQLYLKKFYEQFGFKAVSDVYDEDGIPHIKMTRDA